VDVRILMVSPYPPVRDGIAAYAVQEVARLRRDGHDVEVLSPWPSAAHHHLDLSSRRGPLALAKRLAGYDRVIVQFHPDVFYPATSTAARHIATSLALAAAFRLAGDVEVRVHEADYTLTPRSARALGMGVLWRQVRHLSVHTEAERASFARTFAIPPERIAVAHHGSNFSPRTVVDRIAARRRLGLPESDFVFLAIGFLQPHKGFDRAIRAFARTGGSGCRLEVVGSVRVEAPEYLDHLDELRRLAWTTPAVELREGFVSDELFDVWLVASDAVVLPYRHIWSSGVVERAAMFDRTVIASRVGGLESQSRPGTVLVGDDDELVAAMRMAIGARAVPATAERPWPPPGATRAEVLDAVRARAAAVRKSAPVLGEPALGLGLASDGSAGSGPSAALRRIRPLGLPVADGPPARRLVKRLSRRLTAWQLDPIVTQVNRLHRATADAVDQMKVAAGLDSH
jgi:glycosyltransferase involved in cell wall biosynthesis